MWANGAKSPEAPTEPFKRALAYATRSLAEQPDLLGNDRPTVVLGYMKQYLEHLELRGDGRLALFGRPVTFQGTESSDAFLSNGQLGHRLFGYPRVGVSQMVAWIADWVRCESEATQTPPDLAGLLEWLKRKMPVKDRRKRK